MVLGAWLAPNITPHSVSGIGAWPRDDVLRYLRRGRAPGRAWAGESMGPVVETLQRPLGADLDATHRLARPPARPS